MTYTITVYDQAGEYTYARAEALTAAAKVALNLRESFPRKVVQVTNEDQVDLDWPDGLTDDERAELEGMGL